MDAALAKGLSREFIRKIRTISIKRASNLKKFIKGEKSLNKRFNSIRASFNSHKNDFALHHAEFGSRKRPAIGLTFLDFSETDPGYERKERVITGQNQFFFKSPLDYKVSDHIQFSFTAHMVQRIIERHPEVTTFDYNVIFDLIRKELKYVPIYSSIIRLFVRGTLDVSSIPKNFVHGQSPLIFPIPSENGLFYCHVHGGVPSLRTFLHEGELSERQLALRNRMIQATEIYCSVNFPYFFENCIQFDEGKNFNYVLFFCAVIFLDFKEIFENELQPILGDSLPHGQKKIVVKSLEKYIQDFPFNNSESHERPEIIASYNALYKEALRKNKALALQRKWIVEFNNRLKI